LNTAWIAVIGTLGGVAVTAAAGLLTATLTGRHQRATLERQFQQEADNRIHDERRSVFVDYLKAYDDAIGRAHSIMNLGATVVSPQADRAPPFETEAAAEMSRVNQAYLMITITALGDTRKAARDCTGTLWRIGRAAISGDKESFDREVEAAREPRERLRAAMRRELDVE
jgi:gas vesicle protein